MVISSFQQTKLVERPAHGSKDFEISKKTRALRSLEEMKPELDKCVLLCLNCHAEAHEVDDTQPTPDAPDDDL